MQILEGTDALIWQADTLVDRALLLLQAGLNTGAAECLEGARALYTRKDANLPLHRIDALTASIEALSAPALGPLEPTVTSIGLLV